ncbi:uncharacterized protein JN550_004066 [Neoarthrinium moseri]|uniref:uncharacterized protein n=1 Tax=Neoarthrinium moseri TaxID=1658444 RepID=UPI001FDD9C92|nr:uncharacterized protein JN550_004066 [Neoarthrinium moseri]KAI1872347.1 hypothetical protein JN550_004066 [Neoarthrinium moseri]
MASEDHETEHSEHEVHDEEAPWDLADYGAYHQYHDDAVGLTIEVDPLKPTRVVDIIPQVLLLLRLKKTCVGGDHQPLNEIYFRPRDLSQIAMGHPYDFPYNRWENGSMTLKPVKWTESPGTLCSSLSALTIHLQNAKLARNSRSNLLDLPVELVERILDYAIPPYSLRADIVRNIAYARSVDTTHLIIYGPRSWKQLPLLNVCQGFRVLLSRAYGTPRPDSFPFDYRKDSILIVGQHLNFFGLPEAEDGLDYSRYVDINDLSSPDHWMLNDGIIYTPHQRSRTSPTSHLVRLGPAFARKVQNIEFALDSGTIHTKRDWQAVWRFLANTFTEARIIELQFCELDECGGAGRGWKSRHDHYMAHDLWALSGLKEAIDRIGRGSSFPKLKGLDVVKVAVNCTYAWMQEFHRMSVSEWFFEQGRNKIPRLLRG